MTSGLLIIISGPSGVGKTTITHQLVADLGARFSVSWTTRPMSNADTEGVDYHFVDEDQFREGIDADAFLEWARVFDYFYGTPRDQVMQWLEAGEDVIVEIDVAGAIQVKRKVPEALSIFVLPPNEDVLLQRLRHRKREQEEKILKRFGEAKREIEEAHACGDYDHFIVNDKIEKSVAEAERIIIEHKNSRELSTS